MGGGEGGVRPDPADYHCMSLKRETEIATAYRGSLLPHARDSEALESSHLPEAPVPRFGKSWSWRTYVQKKPFWEAVY